MNTEQILEFDKIKEVWLGLALTDAAKEEIRMTQPCLSERELSEGSARRARQES